MLPWWPVPKARPGSMTSVRRGVAGVSHGGATSSRRPTSIGRKWAFHASAQASSTTGSTVGRASATA